MKTFSYLIALMISVNVLAAKPEVVEAPVDHVFIPRGFDNNDRVEVTVTGNFPNPCYTKNKYDINITGQTIKISLTSIFMDDPAYTKCEPLKIPFTEVVTLGNLQGGKYNVVINQGGTYQINDSMVVGEAQSQSMDDNIYALVEYIDSGVTGQATGEAILIARTPSPCLVLDRVEYLSNNKDTLSILPIMKRISTNCADVTEVIRIPISYDPTKFSSDRILMYARTLDGGSVQRILSK
ncbi:MAG: hypothetical protein ACOYL6_07070 [Bacteriovoracaceae bacterium]